MMPINKRIKLDHQLPNIARDIHTIQQAAYSIEALLLEVEYFPPLNLSPIDIQQSSIDYQGILVDDVLVGTIGYEFVESDRSQNITCLVVLPQWHRQGIATALLTNLLAESTSIVTVSTAVKNQPATSLYAKFGFIEIDRVIKDSIEIVNLQRINEPQLLPVIKGII
jgi:N-acetylglutamate synthase-like GNAT family acetyltransferase